MLVTKSQHSSLWVCFFEAFWKLKAGKHTGGIGHNNIYITLISLHVFILTGHFVEPIGCLKWDPTMHWGDLSSTGLHF